MPEGAKSHKLSFGRQNYSRQSATMAQRLQVVCFPAATCSARRFNGQVGFRLQRNLSLGINASPVVWCSSMCVPDQAFATKPINHVAELCHCEGCCQSQATYTICTEFNACHHEDCVKHNAICMQLLASIDDLITYNRYMDPSQLCLHVIETRYAELAAVELAFSRLVIAECAKFHDPPEHACAVHGTPYAIRIVTASLQLLLLMFPELMYLLPIPSTMSCSCT